MENVYIKFLTETERTKHPAFSIPTFYFTISWKTENVIIFTGSISVDFFKIMGRESVLNESEKGQVFALDCLPIGLVFSRDYVLFQKLRSKTKQANKNNIFFLFFSSFCSGPEQESARPDPNFVCQRPDLHVVARLSDHHPAYRVNVASVGLRGLRTIPYHIIEHASFAIFQNRCNPILITDIPHISKF